MKRDSAAIGILSIVVLLSGVLLFGGDMILGYWHNDDESAQVQTTDMKLNIAYLFTPESLNPFVNDNSVQSRLLDVYEPLVKTDANFKLQPVLALQYGLVSETEWEIKLREGVHFHDNSLLDSEDVIYSFNRAKLENNSYVEELVTTVSSISIKDDKTLQIFTKYPDPLLLNKLSKLLIVPKGYSDYGNPVGTGPYKLVGTNELSDLKYRYNENYWGQLPFFAEVEVYAVNNKNERVKGLLEGKYDVLVDVPPVSADEIEQAGFVVRSMPSLEVGFLMFNFDNKLLKNKEIREALSMSLDKENFLELFDGKAKTVDQFIPNGVFGYQPELEPIEHAPEIATTVIAENSNQFETTKLKFYYPENLNLIGKYVEKQLDQIGIKADLQPLDEYTFNKYLEHNLMDFYYLGWKNESGDALPFLKMVIHSKEGGEYGLYNGNNYKNKQIDTLIEKCERNFNLKERLADMQQIMTILVNDDVVGIPLFETEALMAYKNGIQFIPRLDNTLYPSSISYKSL